MSSMRQVFRTVAAALMLAMAGCGGGGTDAESAADRAPPVVQSAGAPSSTWNFAASEYQSFTVSGSVEVRYGVEPNWITRTASGTVRCTNAFFGDDPAVGVVKHCELFAGGAPLPGTLPSPSIDLDFTHSLPSRVTFTRDGTRNAIVNGTLRALSPHEPAIESWDGVSPGLAIEAPAVNLLTRSDDFADGSWEKGGTAIGGPGPDGASPMALQHERATSGGFSYFQKAVGTQASGTRQTFSAFVRLPAGSTRWAVRLRMANRWDNDGPRAYLRVDGTPGGYTLDDGSATNVSAGLRKLANGIFHVWLTGTWVVAGAKEFEVRLLNQNHLGPVDGVWFGDASQGMEVWGAQVTATPQPVGYVKTIESTASSSAETATIADLSWFDPAQGTIVIEHDCPNGPLLGSGTNTVLTAATRGRTAIAWDGTGSTVVENGGAGTNGATPAFGSDFKLLPSNHGHIKRLTVYPTRADAATLRQLTTLPVVGAARPGVLRAASVDNRLPSAAQATSGVQVNFASRFRFRLGGAPLSSLKLDFANFFFGATGVGNAVVIDDVYLERATGTKESVRVTFAGANGVTLADGAANVLSDDIQPSRFTALREFAASMDFYVRLRGHVSTAGHKLPVSRSYAEAVAQSFVYDSGTITNMAGTGALVLSGGSLTNIARGVAPVLVGVHSSGDPKTLFVTGDSLIEGTGKLVGTGTFARRAAAALGIPVIEFSLGGRSQASISEIGVWKPYLRYCRVLLDELGTNNINQTLHFFSLWKAARDAPMDKVMHVGLLPSTSSTDSFSTEGEPVRPAAVPGRHRQDALHRPGAGLPGRGLRPDFHTRGRPGEVASRRHAAQVHVGRPAPGRASRRPAAARVAARAGRHHGHARQRCQTFELAALRHASRAGGRSELLEARQSSNRSLIAKAPRRCGGDPPRPTSRMAPSRDVSDRRPCAANYHRQKFTSQRSAVRTAAQQAVSNGLTYYRESLAQHHARRSPAQCLGTLVRHVVTGLVVWVASPSRARRTRRRQHRKSPPICSASLMLRRSPS
jgi:hypothetical protein